MAYLKCGTGMRLMGLLNWYWDDSRRNN
jgi:hypothetical protein